MRKTNRCKLLPARPLNEEQLTFPNASKNKKMLNNLGLQISFPIYLRAIQYYFKVLPFLPLVLETVKT